MVNHAAPVSRPQSQSQPRPRPRLRRAHVSAVTPLSPHLVQVSLTGEALAGFEVSAPAQHIKLFLPVPGQDEPTLPQFDPDGPTWPAGAPAPVVRTFTPRRWNRRATMLDIVCALHGAGPAARWAASAQVGDRVAVAGPGGGFPLPLSAPRWLIAGDDSAIGAIATILEALASDAEGHVVIEVGDARDRIALPGSRLAVSWRTRPGGDPPGVELERAFADHRVAPETQVWLACEAGAMRRIRAGQLERGHPAGNLVTRGYWRVGVADHPDRDHGEESATPSIDQ